MTYTSGSTASAPTNSAHKFRKDINGLRAVAVLGVLLFHLFSYLKFHQTFPELDLFSGGYVGVDIFFVISGFLMTAIIVRRLQAGTFSVWQFWKRRAARICPALLAVVILVLAVGFWLQFPQVYRETCREAMRALLFITNFWFARDQGYFTDAVVNLTLLHTWSLSVEWQFYLLYPLLLLCWAKFLSLRTLPYFIGGLLAVSLGVSFALSYNDAAYFMLYSRAWELLIGGLIYMLPPLKLRPVITRMLETAALLVILLNMALAQPMQGWEPLQVLPGTAACALMLWLNVERSLLSNVVLQYTGKISYSLYLIHWPVIAICSKLGLLHYYLPLIIGIVAYSALSYHFIETKRRWHWSVLLVYFLMIGLSQAEVKRDGATPFNHIPKLTGINEDSNYGGTGIPHKGKIFYGKLPGIPQLIIAGDSYAREYGNFLNNHLPFIGVFSDGQLHFDKVWISPNAVADPIELSHLYWQNLQQVLSKTQIKDVIIAQNWAYYLYDNKQLTKDIAFPLDTEERRKAVAQGILALADQYHDKEFYLIGQTVTDPLSMKDCVLLKNSDQYAHRIFNSLECPRYTAAPIGKHEMNELLSRIVSQRPNLHLIDPNPSICKDGLCMTITDQNLMVFSDGTHLSLAGAELFGRYILQQIKAQKLPVKN